MAGRAEQAADVAPNPPGRSTVIRSLAVVVLAAILMLIADIAVSYAVVIASFGRQPWLLVGIPVIAVILVFAVVGILRAITGRFYVLGAVTVALLLVGLGGIGLATGKLTPMLFTAEWWPHFLLAVLCALTLTLFLGPTVLRVFGAAAGVAAIILLVLLPGTADRRVAAVDESRAQADAEAAQQYLAAGRFHFVTDAPSWADAYVVVHPAASTTWTISDTRAIAVIEVTAVADDTDLESEACSRLAPHRSEDHDDWCVPTGDGWARADGRESRSSRAGDL